MGQVSITVNGRVRKATVEPRLLLVHFLREQLNLTGTHIGCDTSQCGACTVLVDGRSAKSCTIFAVQADGSEVTTIEGLATRRPAPSIAGGLLGGARSPVRLLHAGDDHVGRQPPERQPDADRAADPRRHRRKLLPLHRLPAHRQRHSTRRRQEVSPMAASPVLPKLVGQRVKRREDPRLIQGRGTYVDDVKIAGMQHLAFKRSDVAHGRIVSIDTSAAEAMDGVEAVFTGAQIAEFARADADRHALPVAGTSRGGRRRRPLRGRAGRRRRRQRSLRRAGCRRRHRGRLRHAAGGRGSRAGHDRPSRPSSIRPSRTTSPWPHVPWRHGRQRGRRRGRLGHRQGVRRRRRDHLAADAEPAAGADGDRAARRRRPFRAGEGHDDDLVVDAEPARRSLADRGDERPRPGSGPGHRARSRRRLRREDQRLRRGLRGGRRSPSGSGCRSSGPKIDPRPSWPRSTGATCSATSISRPNATAKCSA